MIARTRLPPHRIWSRFQDLVSSFERMHPNTNRLDRRAPTEEEPSKRKFTLYPIGRIQKTKTKTRIVLYKRHQAGLAGVEKLSEIWVLWWFHRSDTKVLRSTLKVHPKGDPARPLTGVFATRAPVRPNVIALTRCKILSVKNNIVEIDAIDAFSGTPVLDLKP